MKVSKIFPDPGSTPGVSTRGFELVGISPTQRKEAYPLKFRAPCGDEKVSTGIIKGTGGGWQATTKTAQTKTPRINP